jgi:hypothetical protein
MRSTAMLLRAVTLLSLVIPDALAGGRPVSQRLRLPAVIEKLIRLGASGASSCASSCSGASYCSCDQHCVCITQDPLPIMTRLSQTTNAYNTKQIDMERTAAMYKDLLCTDKEAFVKEVLYLSNHDSSLKTWQIMMLGSFDDIVMGMLDCACSISPLKLILPYQVLEYANSCKELNASGTETCDVVQVIERLKESVLTLMGPSVLCGFSCRQTLGLIIDKFYGLGKLGISAKLLFKQLPYPIGKETLDCMCGNAGSPAFGFGAMMDVTLAPIVRSRSAVSQAVKAEMDSPAYRKRVFQVFYGPQGLCGGSCFEIWKDVELIYDVKWKPGAAARLPGPPELGSQTYGELMSCTPPSPPTSSKVRSGCPGGSVVDCIGLCPSDPPAIYKACVQNCANKCAISKVEQVAAARTVPLAFVVLSTALVLRSVKPMLL